MKSWKVKTKEQFSVPGRPVLDFHEMTANCDKNRGGLCCEAPTHYRKKDQILTGLFPSGVSIVFPNVHGFPLATAAASQRFKTWVMNFFRG